MGWLRLAVFLQLQVSFAKEPYKQTKFSRRDLQFERAYYPLTPNTSCLVHFETDIERDPPGGVYEKGGGGRMRRKGHRAPDRDKEILARDVYSDIIILERLGCVFR